MQRSLEKLNQPKNKQLFQLIQEATRSQIANEPSTHSQTRATTRAKTFSLAALVKILSEESVNKTSLHINLESGDLNTFVCGC